MAQDLDPTTLRLFVAVCEEGNIARAAEREALVASAVSKRISAIESRVGAPLLVRGRRGVEPTAAGQALLRQAREVLSAMARLQAELSEFASGVQGSVRVVATPAVLAEGLGEDIGAFLARHPAVRVSLDEHVSRETVRSVREGAAEVGVLWDAIDLSGLQVVPYRSDQLCLATPADHALAQRRDIAWAEAVHHVAVNVAPGGMMDVMLRQQAARLGVTPSYRVQVSGVETAARIVAAGLGPAVVPREALQGFAGRGALSLVPLNDAWARRRFVICTRDDGSLAATTRLLVAHLQQQALGPCPPAA